MIAFSNLNYLTRKNKQTVAIVSRREGLQTSELQISDVVQNTL